MIGDSGKKELGLYSQQAIQAVSVATWRESARLFERAEAHYAKDELTPERAQAILIGLIEQRHTHARLVAQVNEGVRAARRIDREIEVQVEEVKREERAATHGLNRFHRSRVPPIPDNTGRDTG